MEDPIDINNTNKIYWIVCYLGDTAPVGILQKFIRKIDKITRGF